MRNVQISQELFMQLLRFHLMEDVKLRGRNQEGIGEKVGQDGHA